MSIITVHITAADTAIERNIHNTVKAERNLIPHLWQDIVQVHLLKKALEFQRDTFKLTDAEVGVIQSKLYSIISKLPL